MTERARWQQSATGEETIALDDGTILARVWAGNPVREPLPFYERDDRSPEPLVCWSGWLDDARPADGWFERSASAWLPSAATERDRVVETLVEAGAIIRPHARHLISDIPACLNLLRQQPEAKLLIEPALFFEPSMVATSDEQLVRIVESLAGSAWGVVLSDVAIRGDGDEAGCVSVAAGQGRLDMAALRALVAEHAGPNTRLIERT